MSNWTYWVWDAHVSVLALFLQLNCVWFSYTLYSEFCAFQMAPKLLRSESFYGARW